MSKRFEFPIKENGGPVVVLRMAADFFIVTIRTPSATDTYRMGSAELFEFLVATGVDEAQAKGVSEI